MTRYCLERELLNFIKRYKRQPGASWVLMSCSGTPTSAVPIMCLLHFRHFQPSNRLRQCSILEGVKPNNGRLYWEPSGLTRSFDCVADAMCDMWVSSAVVTCIYDRFKSIKTTYLRVYLTADTRVNALAWVLGNPPYWQAENIARSLGVRDKL
jgi:hypothetical protein